MRSAAASFGKMERERNSKLQKPLNKKQLALSSAVKLSEENVQGLRLNNSTKSENIHIENQKKLDRTTTLNTWISV